MGKRLEDTAYVWLAALCSLTALTMVAWRFLTDEDPLGLNELFTVTE